MGRINCSTKGAIAELRVEADLLARNFHVFRSESPACPCDLIAMRDGVCVKIEVRTVTYLDKNGDIPWHMYAPQNEHCPGLIDWWALILPDSSIRYLKSKLSECKIELNGAPQFYQPPERLASA